MSDPSAVPTSEGLLDRARELVGAAARAGLEMRLLGGLAVYALSESARRPPLARPYRDFDLAVPAKRGAAASQVLEAARFTPDRHFNALHGARRLIFQAPDGYPVDVLVGAFVMCHTLDIESGFGHHQLTISPADLLLTKLQIVRVEDKDLRDAAALLLDLAPDAAAGGLSVERFVSPLAADWGFYRTVELNLQKLQEFGGEQLESNDAARVAQRIGVLRDAMERTSKTFRWKVRARVGERLTWYEMPEELE